MEVAHLVASSGRKRRLPLPGRVVVVVMRRMRSSYSLVMGDGQKWGQLPATL